MSEKGLSCSFAFNGSTVDVCNGFAILSSNLRPQLTRARTLTERCSVGFSSPFTNLSFNFEADL